MKRKEDSVFGEEAGRSEGRWRKRPGSQAMKYKKEVGVRGEGGCRGGRHGRAL